MLGYLYANTIYMFWEESEKQTVSYEEQKNQGQMSEYIFDPNKGYCVYYPSNRSFENGGIVNNYSLKSR